MAPPLALLIIVASQLKIVPDPEIDIMGFECTNGGFEFFCSKEPVF
jgi:hypothetical protein